MKCTSAAEKKYKVSRTTIYRWKKRYDGTPESLTDKSHRPKSRPNQHTTEEIKLIQDMRTRNPHAGLVVFWVKLMQRGYTRSITGLYRVLRRLGETPVKVKNPKYIPKPYEAMQYPGQRVRIDVKHVPASCIVSNSFGSHKYYQYTAIDEYSRFRSIDDFKKQLKVHNRRYNNFPMLPLKWLSPSQFLKIHSS